MKKNLIGLSLAISLVGLVAGCSSDDSGGGGTSGDAALARAACDKQVADGCDEDSFCEENLLDDDAQATVFECEAEYTALLECMTQATWMCTVSEHFDGPEACSPQLSAYEECRPYYSFQTKGAGGCDGSLYKEDVPFAATCTLNKCTCSDGPNAGAPFNITDCQPAPLWAGIKATCM